MSSRDREIYEGAIHHIWQRGNNREYIFQDDIAKIFLLKQLKEYNKKFDYNLLAYVIMDNHYHLLIQTFKDPISDVMFNINNTSGKFIRDNLKRSGHVYQGRYNSKVVQTNEYFLWLIRYIHRNPVRAKICSNVDDYRWSSHNFYKNGYSKTVNIDFPLSVFDNNKKNAINLYLKFVNADGQEESAEKDFEFFSQNLSQYKGEKIYNETKFELPVRYSLQEIIELFKLHPEELSLLTSGSRKRSLTSTKIAFITKAMGEKYSFIEIANFLNTTQSAISKLLSIGKNNS